MRRAYFEYKVTRQISTGNGETFLAASERPPGGFIKIELGFGVDERPCTDCYKPCTLDYTLGCLDAINRANLSELNLRDPLSVPDRISSVDGDVRAHFKLGRAPSATPPPHRHPVSSADAQRQLRGQLRRGGVRVVKGQYIQERSWLPMDPNCLGRGGIMRRTTHTRDPRGRVTATTVKMIDLRANRLIKEYRAKKSA